MCEIEGCSNQPQYNFPKNLAKYCKVHKQIGMVNIKIAKKCISEGCSITASYNYKNEKKRLYCCKHKLVGMISLLNIYCKFEGCEKTRSFGFVGKLPEYCFSHKLEGMICVNQKMCEYEGCTVSASYNFKGQKRKLYCVTHKEDGMISLKSKYCEFDKCNTEAGYNFPGQTRKYCVLHKETGMIDLASKKCVYPGCIKQASFNFKGEYPRYCACHKEKDMIRTTGKCCLFEECQKKPLFGLKGKSPQYCAEHKTTDMIDLLHKKCNYEKCENRAIYNFKKEKTVKYCVKHKLTGMIDMAKIYCTYEGCAISATYGIPGHKKSRCATHKEKGMILKPNAKCKDCKELAIYGTNRIPKHCETHKTEDEENLLERPCISCTLPYILDKEGKCENCNPESFKTARLAKQKALMDYLDGKDLKGESTDRMIDGGICGKERPDRIYDFGDKIIILECDEFQHSERPCLCEQTRMINISQSIGMPTYFIRFNPDDYEPENKRKKPEDIKKRYKLLSDFLTDIKNKKVTLPSALVSAFYMYYDEWNSIAEEEWKVLMKYSEDVISHV